MAGTYKNRGIREEIICAYRDNKVGPWTTFMRGLLGDVAEKLGRNVVYELNKIDCVYYHPIQDGNNLPAWLVGGTCPVVFDAIVEHENQSSIENEWWKLHIYRAPLKVVIFHARSNTRRSEKLEMLKEMDQAARDNWQGRSEDDDEYLVVIGNIGPNGGLPQWRWWKLVETDGQCDFQPL